MSQESSTRRRVNRETDPDFEDAPLPSTSAIGEPKIIRERTPEELREYQRDTLLLDDDYTTELRLQVVHHGEALLGRVTYEVDILERELIALSTVFNEFLDEVKAMDEKISRLSTSINQSKLQAAQELDQTIKKEVQTVVEQLRLLPRADLDGVEILYQNLDALQDNYKVIEAQIETLAGIGVKTEHIQKNLPALEKGLSQFGQAIEERQMSLLVGEEEKEEKIDFDALRQELRGLIQNQHRAMIKHLHQAQTMANPKEVEMLRRNQAGFEKAIEKINEQLQTLEDAGQDVAELQSHMQPLAAGLKQFERAISSNQFLKFTERIYEEVELINEQIQEAQACDNADDLEVLSENVEVLFENCEVFADELDTMADQGIEIDPIIEHYEVLRMTIEQFERAVQDASNRIGLISGKLAGT